MWDELEEFKHSELASSTFSELRPLTLEQIDRFSKAVWRELASLSFEDRDSMVEGLLDGGLAPYVHAYETEEAARIRDKFERIWDTYVPKNSQDMAAWLMLLTTLLQLSMSNQESEEPPPPTVIIREIPAPIRPLPLHPGQPDNQTTR